MRTILIAMMATMLSLSGASAQVAHCQTQEVVLYMTSWCPQCHAARWYLNAIGVDFFEIDVEKTNNEEVREIARGGVPVIATERGKIRGFDVTAIKMNLCVR
jgi:glutaredoxin